MDSPTRYKGRFIKKKKVQRFNNLRTSPEDAEESTTSDDFCAVEGNRIVDLMFLARQLFCSVCDNVLFLQDIIKEYIIGLCSKWTINCRKCGLKNAVLSSKSHINPETNRMTYDINVKAALGMVDAGIGPTHVNAFLTCLNVPAVHESLLKRNERIAGPAIEKVAQKSCLESSLLEKTLETSETQGFLMESGESALLMESAQPLVGEGDLLEADGPSGLMSPGNETPIAASYDMGWQKRGNGRSYSSLTGHGCLIGIHSKKVLSFGTRNVTCKACSYSNDDHDCRRNWSGSAKAMEGDLAVELLTSSTPLKAAQVKVGTIVGDDDSSTTAKIRSEVGNVEKVSDINHAKKNLGNTLYSMRVHHKILTPSVIKYFQRCFGYALQQNRGKPLDLKRAILNIVPHSFDVHDECGSWCGFVRNPTSYFHRGLPRRMGLEGDILFASLSKAFEKFASIASRLAPCGSTQSNESFNALVASKAPKSRHYGSSESNDFRVAAAVCQKNMGVGYVADVKKHLSMSPGSNTLKHRHWLAQKRMALAEKKRTVGFKRRRLFKSMKQGSIIKGKEAREGETYRSGMGMDANDKPASPQVLDPVIGEVNVLFFDVETTGLCSSSEIIQIGAVGESEFSIFIKPLGPIPERVTELTQIYINNGEMYYKGTQVVHHSASEGLQLFLNFLKSNKKALLVGHNVNFDARMIVAAIEKWNFMEDFMSVVAGFADSYQIFKKILPGRQSYRLESLTKDILGDSFSINAHNALRDALTLKMLLSKSNVGDALIIESSFSLMSYIQRRQFLLTRRRIICTLHVLRERGISQYMVGRIADKGLSLAVLKDVYNTEGDEGLRDLFLKNNVTKSNVILDKLCRALGEKKS